MAWKLTGKHLDPKTGEQVFDPFPGIAWQDWEDEDAFRDAVRGYAERNPDGPSAQSLFSSGLNGFFVRESEDKPKKEE